MAEKNPRVFMDVSIRKIPVGSMTFELFKKVAPNAAENFRALCTGERGIGKIWGCPLFYGGSQFYDLCEGYSYVKGGALSGKFGESIYGGGVPDEKPTLECNERGLLAMNMFDWYGLGSHFTITLEPDEELNRFHIVFGKLVNGWETLDAISKAPYQALVEVTACGVINEDGSRIYGRPYSKQLKKARMFNEDGSRRSRHPHREKAKKAKMCDEDESNSSDRSHRIKAKNAKMCNEDETNSSGRRRKKAKKAKICDKGESNNFVPPRRKEAEKAKMCDEDESISSGRPHRKHAKKKRDRMCDEKGEQKSHLPS